MSIKTILYFYRLHLNLMKTIQLNFKCFPFEKAIRFPVFVFGRIGFEGLKKGCITTRSSHCGSVYIGGGYHTALFGNANTNRSFLKISGNLFLGDSVTIDQGCLVSICKGATVHIGEGVYINRNVRIHAKESIFIGDFTRIGWDSQIYDSNFHYTICHGRVSRINKPVRIDHNVWIGNRVTVSKGAVLPPFSVVAAMSLVNKDFSSYGEACLYGGVPSRFITGDIKRLIGVEPKLALLFNHAATDSIEEEDLEESIRNSFYSKKRNE